MSIQILEKPMTLTQVREIAKEWYGIMIKGTVDVERNKVAIGGDYHMESAELLVKDGSNHNNVWGFNIWFEGDRVLEFDSLVNIKPALGSRNRALEDKNIIRTAPLIKLLIF